MQREDRQASRTGRRALALVGALALTVVGAGTAVASDNPIADKEWALKQLQSNQIHSQFKARGAGVTVAVIDTGVDPNQPDLQGSLVPGINLINPSNPTGDTSDDDYKDSHGTSIATIIAGHPHTGSGGTKTGMIGLADEAKIMPIKVGSGDQGGSNSATDAAIKYATDHGARVISISYGPVGECPQDVVDAVNYALSHNVVVVVATGNTALSGNQVGCPAPVPGVLDVAAIDQNGHMDTNSHYGADVSVAAPGVDIEIGLIGGQYGQNSGSSLAAPFVAAEAALIIGLHPTWTQGQVVADIIDNTAQVANGQSKAGQRVDDHVGYGVIDPLAALGASEPSNTANPLGGQAVSSNSTSSSSGAATAPTNGSTPNGGKQPAASSKSKSSTGGLIVGIIIVVVVIGGIVLFFATRNNRRKGGPGGPGGPGGGGGGGNSYYPPSPPPGSQYAPPPGYQQPGPYQQPQPPQQGGPYQPQPQAQPGPGTYGGIQQQPGPYGQQPQSNPYAGGGGGQQPGGYGQQPGQGNPYQG